MYNIGMKNVLDLVDDLFCLACINRKIVNSFEGTTVRLSWKAIIKDTAFKVSLELSDADIKKYEKKLKSEWGKL